MLINLYVLSLVLGAVLLVVALFFSPKQLDADDRMELPDDATRPSEVGQLEGVGRGDFLVKTIRSRGFWTFFASFFGMTGLVLDGLDLMAPPVAFIVAVAIGAVAATGASAAIRIGSS